MEAAALTRIQETMAKHHLFLVWILTCLHIVACVGPVRHQMTTDYPAAVLYTVGTPPVVDGRARFREIFCQLLAAEPGYPERVRRCEDYLLRLNDEPLPGGIPRTPPDLNNRYRVIVVPGFLNACFADIALPFGDAMQSLQDRGVNVEVLFVAGGSSCDANAVHIAERIDSLDLGDREKVLLVGHSKGVVDILHFLVNYPQASRRIAAVISVAGAVNGSPLATTLDTVFADLARGLLSVRCDTGDGGAVESLRPAVRLSWLAAHPLPESVRYFSIAALTERDNINAFLKNSYDLLRIYSPRNDGLLLISDQLIPGGTLLGYANADHWSIVLPLEDKNRLISRTIQAPEKFPRKVLLHALLAYVAEALENEQEND